MGKASSKIVEKLFVKVKSMYFLYLTLELQKILKRNGEGTRKIIFESIYFSYLTLQAQEILMIVVHPGAVKLWSFCVLIQRKNVGK